MKVKTKHVSIAAAIGITLAYLAIMMAMAIELAQKWHMNGTMAALDSLQMMIVAGTLVTAFYVLLIMVSRFLIMDISNGHEEVEL